MKIISGNIFDVASGSFRKGRITFSKHIQKIDFDDRVEGNLFILPGFVDAHVHIESSMLTPFEYARESLKHGVIASVVDPHEIANVCGLDGVRFMVESARSTPMKVFFGAPSCVPATNMETSGAEISVNDIEFLFQNNICSHLSEMMNYPGLLFDDPLVVGKIDISKKYNKRIDGHAPMLSGADLVKYSNFGITTDHECTTLSEAYEKISLGMMIMMRESSASKDFDILLPLLGSHPNFTMFCTDDCHPDDLQKGYIDKLFKKAFASNYPVQNIVKAASLNTISHYNLPVGTLSVADPADFIIVDNLRDFRVLKTFIDGVEVFNGNDFSFSNTTNSIINNFHINPVSFDDILVRKKGDMVHVIQVIPDSLLTTSFEWDISGYTNLVNPDITIDILKVVVLNRYQQAKPSVGFIKGFGLKEGAIGGSVAHDSHNIIVIGVDDESILKVIHLIQQNSGGLVALNHSKEMILPLPIAGLMSDKSCTEVASAYEMITQFAQEMGSSLKSPFMTMAFMSLLVIPVLKIGDRGLFDVTKFSFINLQS